MLDCCVKLPASFLAYFWPKPTSISTAIPRHQKNTSYLEHTKDCFQYKVRFASFPPLQSSNTIPTGSTA